MGTTTFDVMDLLDIDGGWLTLDGISVDLSTRKRKSIQQTLMRLKREGWVESRARSQNDSHRVAWPSHEYRITSTGRVKLWDT